MHPQILVQRRAVALQKLIRASQAIASQLEMDPALVEAFQPVGTLPAIGESVCITRCHCSFKYRKHGPDGQWIVRDGG